MFLIISERKTFIEAWKAILQPHSGAAFPVQTKPSLATAIVAAENFRPTLVIVDGARCDRNSLTAGGELAKLARRTRILLADSNLGPNAELSALAIGVVGCCSAELSAAELKKIVDVVLKGGIWISRPALPELLDHLRRVTAPAAEPQAAGKLEYLTPRERQIALCVAEGASNKLIAKRLNVSDVTVKAHLTTIFQKLGVSRRVQLALLLSSHKHEVAAA